MLLVVNDMADVRHAVVEAIKKAKELSGYEGDIKVVDAIDALTEDDDIAVGLGVKGYDYMTLSPKQIVTRGASITFLTQTFINAMADHGQAKRLDEGVNYFVVDKVPLHMLSETGPVALDIETGGDSDKEPWATGELLSIALYDGRNAYVIPTELCETQTTADFISALCDKRTVVCHNGTFDMGYLSRRLGIKVYHHDDTLLMHFAMYNTAGEHGLKPLARRWLNAPDWDSANAKYLKGGAHYELIPREQLYLYNCIAEGQPVLTDRGPVPIEDVRLTDRVWDGVEWVHHEGVVLKGTKRVVELDNGLRLTPDHLVLTTEGDYVCAASIQAGIRRPAIGANGPIAATLPALNGQDAARTSSHSSGSKLRQVRQEDMEAAQQPDAWYTAEGVRLSEQRTLEPRPSRKGTEGQVPRNRAAVYAGESHGEGSRRQGCGESFFEHGALHQVRARITALRGLFDRAVRPNRHEWSLRAGELATGIGAGEQHEQEGQHICAIHGADGCSSAPVALSETRQAGLPALGMGANAPVAEGHDGGRGYQYATEEEVNVYDILNAGPRHRFTVSGIVVSNCYDAYWTFQLYMLFSAMLDESPALRDFYEHRMEIAHTMQDVQANGVLVDEEKLKEIGVKCSQDAEDALAWLCAAVGRNDFNPASTKQLKEELQAMYGVQLVSTDSEHLNDLAYDVPETAEFIENLFKYRQAKKLKGTYVDGILSKVGEDGKVHPTYLLHGTKSGRLSSKNPNWQNAPRGADIKKAYVAAPGQKIICCDYSQAELRTVAELSNDENMMAAFQPGAPDFFDNLMTKIYPDEFPTIADYEKFDRENHGAAKDKRATVKGTVYGSNYGRGVPAIAKSLKVPVEQAQSVMDAYYSAYPKLKVWQDSVRESVGNDALGYRTTTPFGLQFKQEVITYKNRHKVGNEALAFVPQSTAAEICLRATVQINKRVGAYGAQVIGSIHDACYVMAPEEHVDKVAHMMETEMHGAAQLVFHRVPFVAEAEVGDNCGEV